MVVTEVRVKLSEDRENEKLLAYCSVTLDDCFVVRDLKVISGTRGPFLAMPSRKLTRRCPECKAKNSLRARYCSWCGDPLEEDASERNKLHVDVAHPINAECREMLQRTILAAVEVERDRAKAPDYVCNYDVY